MCAKNYPPRMKTSLWLPASSALMLILSGCANNTSSSPTGTGPYDSAGNYHEEWADDPSKWRKTGKVSASNDELPLISKNEQPPPNANPLAAQSAMPKLPPAHVESKTVTTKHKIVESSAEAKHHSSTKHKHTASKEEPEEHHTSTTKGTATKHKHVATDDDKSEHHTSTGKGTSSVHKHSTSDDKSEHHTSSDKKATPTKHKHTTDSSDEPKHTSSKPKPKSSSSDQ